MRKRPQKSVTDILRLMSMDKLPQLPQNKLHQVKRILMSGPIYSYEIVGLYHHLVSAHDKNAFSLIDAVLFPPLQDIQDSKLKRISFKLAYSRLWCLLKYEQPYRQWLEYTRQLMHNMDVITGVDVRAMIRIGVNSTYIPDPKLHNFFEEFLQLHGESIESLSVSDLGSLRSTLESSKLRSRQIQGFKSKIERVITDLSQYFPLRHYNLLLKCNALHSNWFFNYVFLNNNPAIKQFGFFFDFLCRNKEWKTWALQKYGRQGVLERLPAYYSESSSILNAIVANFNSPRPYFDEYFELEQVECPEIGRKRKALKNPRAQLQTYIMNAYLVFSDGITVPSLPILKQMNDVLFDTPNVRFNNRAIIFAYLALKNLITYYLLAHDKQAKAKDENSTLELVSHLLQRHKQLIGDTQKSQSIIAKKWHRGRISALRVYRFLGLMELKSFRNKQLRGILDALQFPSEDLFKNIKISPKEIKPITKVIETYIGSDKATRPLVLSNEFKKHPSNGSLQIYIARNIDVDRIVLVDFMLKIKSEEGLELELLIDLGPQAQVFEEDVTERERRLTPVRYYWKKQYIADWCHLKYEITKEQSIEEYIDSQQYLKFIRQGSS